MAIGIIVGIVLAILAIVAFVGCYVCADNNKGAGAGICGVLGVLLVLAFIVVPFSFHTVDTGELAVVKKMGKITHVREAGTNFDLWFINSYQKYDTKVQNVDITTAAYSSDAQTMNVAMTLQYQISPDKVIDIATQYGSLEVLQNRIQSIAIEKTKAVLSSYKAMDIIAQRSQISPAVEIAIKDAIGDEYFVKVNTVVLSNIDFSDAFEAAVEDKMIAEQAKLKADYENEKKIAAAKADADAKLKAAQAEIEIAQAQADAKLKEAQAQKAIAEAEAEALRVKAQAEAEANRIITESITQELLDKILAENWDGKLPNTYVGDGSDLGIILPNP
jgi:regulator of protease activity HflC (stomatin/prohibitin superfamily)